MNNPAWALPSFEIPEPESTILADRMTFVQAAQVDNFCIAHADGIESVMAVPLSVMRNEVKAVAESLGLCVIPKKPTEDGGDFMLMAEILTTIKTFGLQGADTPTSQQISSHLNVPEERIKQVLSRYGLLQDGEMLSLETAWWRNSDPIIDIFEVQNVQDS